MVVVESDLRDDFLRELTQARSADIFDLATRIRPNILYQDHSQFLEALAEVATKLEEKGVIRKDGKHAEDLVRRYREAGTLPEDQIKYVTPYRIA